MKRRRKQRFNGKLYGKPIGMYGLIFILAITIGIARDRNVKADTFHTNRNIVATSSIYNSKDKTTNIIENGVEAEVVKTESKSPPIKKTMPNYKLNLSLENQKLIYELCQKNGLSYEFVLSVFNLESGFRANAINKNTNGTSDSGIAQLNSRFMSEYEDNAITYCNLPKGTIFDPFNAEHGIRAGIGTLTRLKNYWVQKGVNGADLMPVIVGSYNLGTKAYEEYIQKTGTIEREYSKQIQKRKDKLKTSNTL